MPYLFNGKELDTETGLYYYGARYYDPRVSLWLNVDPLAEKTMTPYAYTNNNPINLIDPTGMESESIHIDKYGNILKNVNDGDNGVYIHQNATTKSDIDKVYNKNNTSAGGRKIGEIGGKLDINEIYTNTLNENIKESKGVYSPFTFRNYVKTNGKWDLKNNKNTVYGLTNDGKTQFLFNGQTMESQDIGNHHFGVVALAYGLFPSEEFILEKAGEYQIKSGTSKPEWQRYKIEKIFWIEKKTILPPYGDDPRDQQWIKAGFKYYKNRK